MGAILIILVLMVIVQIGLIYRKMQSIKHSDELMMVSELMHYVDSKKYSMTDERGMDALMIACANNVDVKSGELGYFDVVKRAVANGFEVNRKSLAEGRTPLMYAVRARAGTDSAKFLLKAGADVNIQDNEGRTVIFDAVKRSSDVCFNEVLEKVSDINHQDQYGVNGLMIAAFEMNFDRINDLLDRGANAKLKNNAGENAYDVAKKHASRHIRRVVESQNLDEGSKPQNVTTSEDVLNAQKHNHEVREMVRKLNCIVNDEAYEYKKFKRPFLRTGKAN